MDKPSLELAESDTKTGVRSSIKSLGQGNPVTVGISGEKFSGSFTVQGGKCLRKDK
jgi:hypothetical protein